MKARILNKIMKEYGINAAEFDTVLASVNTEKTKVLVAFAYIDGNYKYNWVREFRIPINPAEAELYETNGAERIKDIKKNI